MACCGVRGKSRVKIIQKLFRNLNWLSQPAEKAFKRRQLATLVISRSQYQEHKRSYKVSLPDLYRVVQNHLEEFVRQFKWALSSRQVFEWQKMTRPETLTDIQRAARFFYLQHHAFAGKVSGQTFGTATTGPAINLLRIEENLSAAWQRLSGTYVENLPWLECAERYDRAHTFHYMDPPYWQTVGYGVDFPFENYERMADFMRRCDLGRLV